MAGSVPFPAAEEMQRELSMLSCCKGDLGGRPLPWQLFLAFE